MRAMLLGYLMLFVALSRGAVGAETPYSKTVTQDRPVVYLQFDNQADADRNSIRDSTGKRHGELTGQFVASEGVPGTSGSAATFDGRTTVVTIAHSDALELDSLSIEFWFRTKQRFDATFWPGSATLISNATPGAGTSDWTINAASTKSGEDQGRLLAESGPAGKQTDLYLFSPVRRRLNDDRWHHVVWTRAADDANRLCLDGEMASRGNDGGGRATWNDAGQTLNVHFIYFDTGKVPVVMGLSNLTEHNSAKRPGPGGGYIAYCEGGRLEGKRGRARAFDNCGREIRTFQGTSGEGLHQQNVIDAVRSRDASTLNAEVEVGHLSTGWCNLANIAFRSGNTFTHAAVKEVDGDGGTWGSLRGEMTAHLGGHGIDIESAQIKLSPMLTVDVEKEVFVGNHAKVANSFLERQYRKGYEVPEIA